MRRRTTVGGVGPGNGMGGGFRNCAHPKQRSRPEKKRPRRAPMGRGRRCQRAGLGTALAAEPSDAFSPDRPSRDPEPDPGRGSSSPARSPEFVRTRTGWQRRPTGHGPRPFPGAYSERLAVLSSMLWFRGFPNCSSPRLGRSGRGHPSGFLTAHEMTLCNCGPAGLRLPPTPHPPPTPPPPPPPPTPPPYPRTHPPAPPPPPLPRTNPNATPKRPKQGKASRKNIPTPPTPRDAAQHPTPPTPTEAHPHTIPSTQPLNRDPRRSTPTAPRRPASHSAPRQKDPQPATRRHTKTQPEPPHIPTPTSPQRNHTHRPKKSPPPAPQTRTEPKTNKSSTPATTRTNTRRQDRKIRQQHRRLHETNPTQQHPHNPQH